MKVIGLTGGVGAGKSTVLTYLEDAYHAWTIQADQVGHLVMEPGERCYDPMIARFPGSTGCYPDCSHRRTDRAPEAASQGQSLSPWPAQDGWSAPQHAQLFAEEGRKPLPCSDCKAGHP